MHKINFLNFVLFAFVLASCTVYYKNPDTSLHPSYINIAICSDNAWKIDNCKTSKSYHYWINNVDNIPVNSVNKQSIRILPGKHKITIGYEKFNMLPTSDSYYSSNNYNPIQNGYSITLYDPRRSLEPTTFFQDIELNIERDKSYEVYPTDSYAWGSAFFVIREIKGHKAEP